MFGFRTMTICLILIVSNSSPLFAVPGDSGGVPSILRKKFDVHYQLNTPKCLSHEFPTGEFGFPVHPSWGNVDSNGILEEYVEYNNTSCKIKIDTTRRLILEMSWNEHGRFYAGGNSQDYSELEIWVYLKDLKYDSAAIFVEDSDFTSHVNYAKYEHRQYSHGLGLYSTCTDSLFESLDLSMIFRPTHLTKRTSGVFLTIDIPDRLVFDYGSSRCIFTSSLKPRIFEIYSLLGQHVVSLSINPGETTASIPHLHTGYYFVRFGDRSYKLCASN
jgi:hypothetical protein